MRSSATATASARRKAGSIVMTVPPWRIRSAANAVSDAVGERDRRAVLGGDLDLVKSGPAPLLLLPPLGDQRRVRRHRVEERDRDVERDRRLAVGIARGAEGDVGEGEDDAAVRVALEVHHVRLEPEAHAAVATAQVEVLDAEDRKSTRLNSSHSQISYAVFCLKKNNQYDPGSPVSPGGETWPDWPLTRWFSRSA